MGNCLNVSAKVNNSLSSQSNSGNVSGFVVVFFLMECNVRSFWSGDDNLLPFIIGFPHPINTSFWFIVDNVFLELEAKWVFRKGLTGRRQQFLFFYFILWVWGWLFFDVGMF
ncbi:hypothetical protein L1049_028257 [Liquidambar formosana]|uniref:Uncharacterized protein n=1 Tax=Liquidambar formosana TaxID=63359 RepID=A0AAP0RK45_LIQFO